MNEAARETCKLVGTICAVIGVGAGAYVLASGYVGHMASRAVMSQATAVILLTASIEVDEAPEGE
jgi:hypothetical protein